MANKRFTDIYSAVTSEVRDTSSAFTTIAKRYTNDGYLEILRRLIEGNIVEQYRTFSLTVSAGTRSYAAPPDFGEVVYAIDTSNNRELSIGTETDIYSKYITMVNTSGTPFLIVPRADSNFMAQPSVSNALRVVSTNASDTSQTIFLRGISGSAEFYESVSLNGTTSASSSNSYDYLLEAVKSATTLGKVTITYITDAATASVISPDNYTERFKVLEFFFIPAGSYTYTIRYRRLINPMTQDNDVPIVDVAQGIEYFAIARSWEYKRQLGTAQYFMNKFETWYQNYVTDRDKTSVQQFEPTPYPREY